MPFFVYLKLCWLRSFGKEVLISSIDRFLNIIMIINVVIVIIKSKTNNNSVFINNRKLSLCFLWVNEINFKKKMISKDNTISYHFTMFISARSCDLFSFKHFYGVLIFLWEQLVYPVTIVFCFFFRFLSFVLLTDIVDIKILSTEFFSPNLHSACWSSLPPQSLYLC